MSLLRRLVPPVTAALLAIVAVALTPGGLHADEDAAAAQATVPDLQAPLPSRQPFPPPLLPLVGGHLTEGDARNPAVYPPERVDMFFNHETHINDLHVTCVECHVDAPKSRSAKDDLVPTKAACLGCHDPLEVPAEWSSKGDASSALSLPAAHLRFSHHDHVEEAGIECLTCHAGVDQLKVATRQQLPSMETCVRCHANEGKSTDCRTCHLPGRAGTIRTAYPSGTLIPDDHGLDYVRRHGIDAERDVGTCAACHAQEDCLSCHDGAVPPSFHESNYLLLHPQEGMANAPPCASCHRVDRFCRDCHFKSGVTMGSPLLSFLGGAFHPAGWMDATSPDHHGQLARRNLQQCAGCHAKQDCISCHAFDPSAPRIHPPGFGSSRRARQLQSANPGLCLECHGFGVPGDPIGPP
jgi:hypothetical protein